MKPINYSAFYELSASKGCIAKCSYCKRLNHIEKDINSEVVPLHGAYVACNAIGSRSDMFPPTVLRRWNTRLFKFYSEEAITAPGQWVIDGLLPEIDLEAMKWAEQRGVIHSLVLILRPSVNYSLVLSYLELTDLNVPIYLISDFSADNLHMWWGRCHEFYPKVSAKLELLGPVSSVFSEPIIYSGKKTFEEKELSVVVQADEKLPEALKDLIEKSEIEFIQISTKRQKEEMHQVLVSENPAKGCNFALEIANGKKISFFNYWPSIEELEMSFNSERFEVVVHSVEANSVSFSIDRVTLLCSQIRFVNELGGEGRFCDEFFSKVELMQLKVLMNEECKSQFKAEDVRYFEGLADEYVYRKKFSFFKNIGSLREIFFEKYIKSSFVFNLAFALTLLPLSLLKSLSDISHQYVYGTGAKINMTWLYWSTVFLKHRFIWSLIWPIVSMSRSANNYVVWSLIWPFVSFIRVVLHFLRWTLFHNVFWFLYHLIRWVIIHHIIWSLIWPLISLFRFLMNKIIWSLIWPISYPLRKIYYYLEFKVGQKNNQK